MIRAADISVVVQGPVVGKPGDAYEQRLTRRCLDSVRAHLPSAEIVLSTWAGADVSDLPFDRLVESEDPGGMRCDPFPNTRWSTPTPYNANRQVVSTRNGLREATRPVAMKLRGDMVLTGTGFLRYFLRYPKRADGWRILRDRVVIPDWFTRNPRGPRKQPHHPSDWFHFGWREDLLDMWDTPLTDAAMPLWYETHPRPPELTDTWLLYRYTVEQCVWLGFLRKHGEVDFDHKLDARPHVVKESELIFANNLVVASMAELDLRFLKYGSSRVDWGTLYTHGDWQRLYRDYCDPTFRPGFDAAHWRKAAYNHLVAPTHRFLSSPRDTALARAVSTHWEEAFPRSFRAAKRAYVSAFVTLGRLGRPRA